MPLNRTWWNNLVDDDGSNAIGTVWNKNQIAGLMDTIDVSLGQSVLTPEFYLPFAGGFNDFNPAGAAAAPVWLLSPTAGGTFITGVAAPVAPGTRHLVVNVSAFTLYLPHLNAGSAATAQFIGPGYADFNLLGWKTVWIYWSPLLVGGKWLICG